MCSTCGLCCFFVLVVIFALCASHEGGMYISQEDLEQFISTCDGSPPPQEVAQLFREVSPSITYPPQPLPHSNLRRQPASGVVTGLKILLTWVDLGLCPPQLKSINGFLKEHKTMNYELIWFLKSVFIEASTFPSNLLPSYLVVKICLSVSASVSVYLLFCIKDDRASYEQFCSWLLKHSHVMKLSAWLLQDSNKPGLRLSDESDTPTFYQTLAGVTHCKTIFGGRGLSQ